MRASLGTVLIVDSDLKIIEALASLLKMQDIKVLKSYSIRESLVKIDRQRFSLIILGTHFPEEHYEDLLLAMDVGESLNFKTPALLLSKKPTDEIFEGVQHRIIDVQPAQFDPMDILRISTKVLTTT